MRTRREIAENYVQCFCGNDVQGLAALLAPGLRFTGPLYNFNSAQDYLESLENDPPEECGYEIFSVTENEDCVALFYKLSKPDRVISIAQLFRIERQKIQETVLVFDTRAATQTSP